MNNLKAVIVDDESKSIENLRIKLVKYCPEVIVINEFQNPIQAVEFLNAHEIDILFLDVDMPELTGFDVIERLQIIPTNLIFITAYNEYAIKAIKYSALDYLLKPVGPEELKTAVAKCSRSRLIEINQIKTLLHNIMSQEQNKKIALTTSQDIEFLHLNEVVYCSSDSNYTNVFLTDGQKRKVTKTLKDVLQLFDDNRFVRTHNSYVVNIQHVRRYSRSEAMLVLTNGSQIPVSRSRREELMANL